MTQEKFLLVFLVDPTIYNINKIWGHEEIQY